jgi:predicted transcriptional regulator
MSKNKAFVSGFMSKSPVYVKETDLISTAMNEMQRFKIETISVVSNDFSIVGCITQKQINNVLNLQSKLKQTESLKIKDIITKNKFPIILYPHLDITNAFSMMKCLNKICAPVAESPWEKKMIGVLWLNDVN